MQPVQLSAGVREAGKGISRNLRRNMRLPAVLYGQGKTSLSVSIGTREFERVMQAGGTHPLVALEVEGHGSRTAVVKALQRHPATGSLLHVDFQEVSLTHRMSVRVPVLAQGTEELEGMGVAVQHQSRELEVECLPLDIPEYLVVDVGGLKAGDIIRAASVPLPPGVSLLSDPEEIVLGIVLARMAEAAEPQPAADAEAAAAEPPAKGTGQD